MNVQSTSISLRNTGNSLIERILQNDRQHTFFLKVLAATYHLLKQVMMREKNYINEPSKIL
jgi:hypothetical protein